MIFYVVMGGLFALWVGLKQLWGQEVLLLLQRQGQGHQRAHAPPSCLLLASAITQRHH